MKSVLFEALGRIISAVSMVSHGKKLELKCLIIYFNFPISKPSFPSLTLNKFNVTHILSINTSLFEAW